MRLFTKRTQITAILLVFMLLLAACERPFRTDGDGDGDSDEPATTEGVTEDGEDSGVTSEQDDTTADDTTEQSDTAGETEAESSDEESTDDEASDAGTDEDASRPEPETDEGSDDEGEAADGAETDESNNEAEGAEQEGEAGDSEQSDDSQTEQEDQDSADTEEEAGDDEEEQADDEEEGDDDSADDEEAEDGTRTHVVAFGENLYRIGLQYGVSWVAIAQANNIVNADRIYVGQILTIPGETADEGDDGEADEGDETGEITHIVQAGETLHTIGLQYGVSWTQIAEANGLVNPNYIVVGQLLKVPTDAPGPAPQFVHTVRAGETLFILSLRYGVLWTDIATANEIEAPYVIFPGQQLIIPGG